MHECVGVISINVISMRRRSKRETARLSSARLLVLLERQNAGEKVEELRERVYGNRYERRRGSRNENRRVYPLVFEGPQVSNE